MPFFEFVSEIESHDKHAEVFLSKLLVTNLCWDQGRRSNLPLKLPASKCHKELDALKKSPDIIGGIRSINPIKTKRLVFYGNVLQQIPPAGSEKEKTREHVTFRIPRGQKST